MESMSTPSYCNRHFIMLDLKEKCTRHISNYDRIMVFLFFSSLSIVFPILLENRNSIWAPFWCICFPVSLSFTRFEIMQDYVSIFFAWNIKLYWCSSYPTLSFSAGPRWHQPENGSFNLQENKLRILISKSAVYFPLEKNTKKTVCSVKTCSLQLSGACRCVCFHLGIAFTWNDTLKAVFYFNQTGKIYTQT